MVLVCICLGITSSDLIKFLQFTILVAADSYICVYHYFIELIVVNSKGEDSVTLQGLFFIYFFMRCIVLLA
jgi:hypothetical protein